MEDTIAAISTALGVGAISIIRVSGTDAVKMVNQIFQGTDLTKVSSHTINYGYILDGDEKIDEVLVSVMRAPKTFTREDVVEVNVHGGIATTNRILELLITNGCRLAEPGEFTKRAFLNGRIDLIEAEGVMDLINAKTEKARNLAINQLSGNVSKLISDLRQNIVDILANIEVNIDYPEYDDIEVMTIDMIRQKMGYLEEKIKDIIERSQDGIIIKDGIKTAIIGRPNVGKSSILNALLEEDKAIVTNIAGTTRDIVEGQISLDGILLNIIDTAGIRRTDDIVESIGVKKSLNLIDEADLILYVLNNNDNITPDDVEILEKIKDKNSIVIVNKMDLKQKIDLNKLKVNNLIMMSIVNNEGIDSLKRKIKQMFNLELIEQSDYTYLSSARSIGLLKNVLKSVENVKLGIENHLPIDMIEIDLKEAWSMLGEIIGESYSDELIDQIFSQFCVGK